MRSLTRTEAADRSASLHVSSYDVALDLTRGDATFGSRTVISFDSRDLSDTWVDIQPAQLLEVRLNGKELDPAAWDDGRVPLTGLAARNELVIDAAMSYSRDGEGLHRAVDPEDDRVYVYAMTFLPAAPRVFACFDQPDLKAVYRVSVAAPTDWIVLGNGAATQQEPGRWTLEETEPLATYFATLVAGPYHSLITEHDGIKLGLACRQSLAPHLDKDREELFQVTAQCFDEYHRLFGIRYPFGEYHQVFVPEFNAGAMENPGCVTFDDHLVFKAQATDSFRATRATVIAHEMAHQWFGDLVTMTWWDDLWLNESFATYMGYRVTNDVTAFDAVWLEFAYAQKAWGMASDQRRSTHPVAGNGAEDAQEALNGFDGISYSKGAAILRQLQAYLGDDAFLSGVIAYLQAHRFGNATFADLIDSWQHASGKDISTWADAWLRTSGADTLATEVSDGGGDVSVVRRPSSDRPVSRPHAFSVTWFAADGAATTVPLVVEDDRTPVALPGYDGTGLILPDSGDQAWAKIILDKHSAERAPDILTKIEDPLARAVVWSALLEAVYDAELDPETYLSALEKALPSDSDLAVEKLLASDVSGAIKELSRYFPLETGRGRLAALTDRVLADATPASNRQLIAARALTAVTPDDDRLTGWLGGDVPAGVTLDDDLRWRIIRSLCEAGVYGPEEIEAERRRDPSSRGQVQALRCTASLPDAETKARVWQTMTTDDSVSNDELYAYCRGFFRPGQDELTRPYVSRYFAELPATAGFRTGWMVEHSTLLAYPAYAVSDETLALAEQCLANGQLNAMARRSISDETDDLARVVASRRAFPLTSDG